ncbi:MAG TPA: J domain-containing protein [Acidimicrobiales bacterium]|nr:J domain-containing protein [Acidimicrobiales bacterium]
MDPWQVLDTPRSAGVEGAKRAWRELVALYHPDHHADMPPGVQARAAAGLRRVNEAWTTIRDAAGAVRAADDTTAPPQDEPGVISVEGAPFDAKRRIKQAAKAANLTVKTAADATLVVTRGSFASKNGLVLELTDQDGTTEVRVADGPLSLAEPLFAALRGDG